MRRTVRGILVVQEHNHPHVLLLKRGHALWKLPGGRLRPQENEVEGLKRKLLSKLESHALPDRDNFQIGECVAEWWNPSFEPDIYPYCPPHITRPKEHKKLFLVRLPERKNFSISNQLQLVAVPFFELYDNAQKYGKIISSIPENLSRFQFNMVNDACRDKFIDRQLPGLLSTDPSET